MTQENLKKLLKHFLDNKMDNSAADLLSKYPHLKPVEEPVVETKSKVKR